MKKIGVVEGYYGDISKFEDRKKIIESLNKYNLWHQKNLMFCLN